MMMNRLIPQGSPAGRANRRFRIRNLGLGALSLVALLAAGGASAITIDHSDRGAFVNPLATGGVGTRSPATPGSGDNYQLRARNPLSLGLPPGPPVEFDRNFHSFDLSGLSGTVATATLRVWLDVDAYDSSAASETVGLFDVSTAASVLADPSVDPVAAAGAYGDLGSGTSYGTFDVTAADDSSYVDVVLNGDAIAALNAAVGLGSWSVGGALLTIDGTYSTGGISERVLKNDSSTGFEPAAQLVLAGTVVPEPSTALLLLGGLGLLSRIERPGDRAAR